MAVDGLRPSRPPEQPIIIESLKPTNYAQWISARLTERLSVDYWKNIDRVDLEWDAIEDSYVASIKRTESSDRFVLEINMRAWEMRLGAPFRISDDELARLILFLQ